MTKSAKTGRRPNLSYGLQICRSGILHYEPTLQPIDEEAIREYAARRLLRDHYIKHPRELATDIRFYIENYEVWWEQWRNQPH